MEAAQEQQITICFNMAERPVKQLVNAYFRKFCSIELVNTCKILDVNIYKIPKSYIQAGNFSTMLIPQTYLQHDSLYKIPPKVGEMRIIKNNPALTQEQRQAGEVEKVPIEFWLLYLELVSQVDATWDESKCTYFAPDVAKVKTHIGQLLSMSHVDSRYPTLSHSEVIATRFRHIQPDEPGGPMYVEP